jgi:hypothetical protein
MSTTTGAKARTQTIHLELITDDITQAFDAVSRTSIEALVTAAKVRGNKTLQVAEYQLALKNPEAIESLNRLIGQRPKRPRSNNEAAILGKRTELFGEEDPVTQEEAVARMKMVNLLQQAISSEKKRVRATGKLPEKKSRKKAKTSSGSPPPSDASENGAQEDDSSSDSDGED